MLRLLAPAVGVGASLFGFAEALKENAGGGAIDATSPDNSPVVLDVSVKNVAERNDTSPHLYGWMFEDINHSGDGGIYAEMISNRAFQGSTAMFGEVKGVPGSSVVSAENPVVPFGPTLDGWRPVGDAMLSLNILHPLSEALPTVLQVDIPYYATGEVGFLNEGWWGIDVRPQTYNASFYMKANAPRDNATLSGIDVSLRSNLTDDVWSTTTIPIEEDGYSSFDYMQFHAQIMNDAKAPNSNNTFAVTFNASEVAGSTLYFNLISLFPETYKDRPNGLRKDLAQGIEDLNPTFLRFPGGNNLEGYSISERWKWNETIGPLKDRKGRVGDWNYYNTNGLGLLEFLEWTEDIGIEPFLGVYAGFSLDVFGQEGTSFPEDRMGEVLEEVLGELEYCMGDETTHYGKLRAEHGHPEPFDIKYIEIGNEDWFSTTYPYRFPFLYEGIKKAYPDVIIVSSTYNEHEDYTMDLPPGTIWDAHHYQEPSFYLNQFNYFDNWQNDTGNEDVNILVGEYSVFQIDTESGEVDYTNPPDIHVAYPRLLSALAEGVYLLAAERNPDVVSLSCYAPSFQNFNWYNWTPNLVGFTANYDETVFSVSYYLQQLFATHRGKQTLPVKASKGHLNPLYWVATIDDTDDLGTAYFKVINSGNTSVPITLNLDEKYDSVNGTTLTDEDLNVHGFNYMNNQTAIVPAPLDLSEYNTNYQESDVFEWEVPPYSINVLQFDLC